jgi:hypothetical protein
VGAFSSFQPASRVRFWLSCCSVAGRSSPSTPSSTSSGVRPRLRPRPRTSRAMLRASAGRWATACWQRGAPVTRFSLDDGALDSARFEALLEQARHDEAAAASDHLREALALWRGPPLADFAYESFAQDEIRRLEHLRLSAVEDRIEADLALGRHEQVPARARVAGGGAPVSANASRDSCSSASTAPGARPRPSRHTARPGAGLSTSSGSSPGRSSRPWSGGSSGTTPPCSHRRARAARSRDTRTRRLGRRGRIAAAVLVVAAVIAALLAFLLPAGSKASAPRRTASASSTGSACGA